MTTETSTATEPGQDLTIEQKISQLRELFADAPEVGKTALEKVLSRLTSDASKAPPPPVESAGRVGSRLGKVSELTIIVPFACCVWRWRLPRLERLCRSHDGWFGLAGTTPGPSR